MLPSHEVVSLGLLEQLALQGMIPHGWEATSPTPGHRGRIESALRCCSPETLAMAICFETAVASFAIGVPEDRAMLFRVEGIDSSMTASCQRIRMENAPRRISADNSSRSPRVGSPGSDDVERRYGKAGWAKM